jgi:hypothetical protein
MPGTTRWGVQLALPLALPLALALALAMAPCSAAPVPAQLSIQAPVATRWLHEDPGGDALRAGSRALLSVAPIADSDGGTPAATLLLLWRIARPGDGGVYGTGGEWIASREQELEEVLGAGESGLRARVKKKKKKKSLV